MKKALKKILHFLRLRNISTIEVPEVKSKVHLNFEDTDLEKRFQKYKNEREELSLNVETFFILSKFDQKDANQVLFEITNTETQDKFDGSITSFKDGIVQLKIDTKSNQPINIFPTLDLKSFLAVKIGDKGNEVFFDNRVEIASSDYLKKVILGDTEYIEVSLYVNVDPFYIEYRIYNKFSFIPLSKLELITIKNMTAFKTTHYASQECYGLPERNSTLRLKDDSYRLFNVDKVASGVNSDQLYGSVPLLYNKHSNTNIFSAFLVDNPSDASVLIKTNNLDKNASWRFATGNLSCYFYSDEENKIFYKNCKVTGFSYLPPVFALGYHQCRYGYNSLEDAMTTEKGFNDHDIPLDVFWFDIDHTDKNHYFTWNQSYKQEDRLKFINLLETEKRKLVTIIDPHLSTDPNYTVSQEVIKANCAVLDSNKQIYKGKCWPGESIYGDFINPNIQNLYSNIFYKNEDYFMNAKNIYTWCDMNEPSVFESPDQTFPKTNLHFDGKDFVEHEKVHNIYGQLYNKTCNEAIKLRYPGTRPFTLTRSTYTGSQQISFHWTGDNTAKWEFLKNSLEMLMTLGYSGMNNCGADVGGFMGNPTEELFGYWYEVGTFYPFYRGHSTIDSMRREPWVFGEKTLNRVRNAIKLRYNLLPFFYTSSYISSHTGRPHIKPYEDSDHLYCYGDTFILVVKDISDKDDKDILKKKKLFDFRTGAVINDESSLNKNSDLKKNLTILVKSGNIIPWIDTVGMSSYFTLQNGRSVLLYPDENGNAKGLLYYDDYSSYDYQKENYTLIEYTLSNFSNFSSKILNQPKTKNNEKIDEPSDFIENIYLYGHPTPEKVKIVDHIVDTFTMPISYNLNHVKEKNLLHLSKMKIKTSSDFEIKFS